MASKERLKHRRTPADPERAYAQWVEALTDGLPTVEWEDAEAKPPREWLWAAELAGTPGSAGLADYVEGMCAPELDERLVIELVAGCERLKAWASAKQADLMTEIHTRSAGAPRARFIDDELRMRMGITGYAAGKMEDRARLLAAAPEVHKALRAGWIDERKADVFLEGTATVGDAAARAIHRMFIPRADTMTPPQLRRKIEAAVLAIDPAKAEDRHQRAKKTRTVSLRAATDGMAWLSAFLPAASAMAAFTAIDVLAGDASADDDRPIGARRADAFTKVFTETLATGRTPGGCTLGTRQGARPHVVVTMSAKTFAGDDDAPAYLAGYGPITAGAARAIADDQARYSTVFTDPVDGTYRSDGHDSAALRQRLPFLPSDEAWEKERARLSAHDPQHLIDEVAAARAAQGRGASPVDPVAHLEQLGLRAADSYAPSAALRRHIVMRDVTCRFPGCRVPGWKCQLDHIDPFNEALPAWAQTVESNLHLLCAHHHQLKTTSDWRVWRDAYGATHWVSPNQYHEMVLPEPIDPDIDAEAYRSALAGLHEELGDRLASLRGDGEVDPGCAEEYDPGNLALGEDLDVIAQKLREASGAGPQPGHGEDRAGRHSRPAAGSEVPRARPWLNHVPRRAPTPEKGGSQTPARSAEGDDPDRPPF